MSKETLLEWLPYVLVYVLVFRDPYSALIPVREPTLTYSTETTWLLDGTTNETDFGAAYNRRFKDLLQDERNAFLYFVKAVDDAGLTPAAKKVLSDFPARGSNLFCIPLPGPGSSVWKRLSATADEEGNPAALPKDNAQEEVFEIIDQIDLPVTVDRYEEPLFSSQEDKNRISLLMGRYILNLANYGQDREFLAKALAQLRLLAHTSDSDRLGLVVTAYRHLVSHGPAKPEELRQIEKDLPPWPNARTLVARLQRASTTDHLASRNRRLEEIIGKVRKKDSDFCLDQNEVLRIVHRYFMNLEQALPDKPLDEACSLKSTIESIATAAGKSAEKRPMAERMLFSGSIADRHRRAAQYIGGLFCQKQAKQLCAVLDNLTAIRQHIEKNNSEEKRQATAPSATNDAEPKAKDTQKNGP